MNQNTLPNRRIHDPEATMPAVVNTPSQSAQTVAHIPMPPSQPTVAHIPVQSPYSPAVQMPMPPPPPAYAPRPMPASVHHKKGGLGWLWVLLGIGILGMSSVMAVIMGVVILQADSQRNAPSPNAVPFDQFIITLHQKIMRHADVMRILVINPLVVRVYDPVTGDSVFWEMSIEQWDSWLSATPDNRAPNGYRFQIYPQAVTDFLLSQQDRQLDASRFIRIGEALDQIQLAIETNREAVLRVYHNPRQHIVRAGESITSIAWDYGIPYLYIQQANNNISALSVGQTITIPPADMFLELPPVANKRIEVSIAQQRVRVYENGILKWDWVASTGINSSPTWRGVYQILSHEINAYAGNWNLWMPNFIGVYRPVPGSDFTNGFHGFPTRGGGQLLWENNLGGRVTYGCILLSNANIRLLYDWAEAGVVVQID